MVLAVYMPPQLPLPGMARRSIWQKSGRLLALTEIRAFYAALLPQLAEVEPAGPARGIESNFTGGLKSLPIRVRWR